MAIILYGAQYRKDKELRKMGRIKKQRLLGAALKNELYQGKVDEYQI